MRRTDPRLVDEVKADARFWSASLSGYGGRVPTRYRIKMLHRWRRVWAGGPGAYVVINGEDVFLDPDTEKRLAALA